MKQRQPRSFTSRPEDDNLQLSLNKDGSEKYRYATAEFLTASPKCKVYRHTLTESYPLHWLEFYELILVIHGRGVHSINGRAYALKPGTLCLLTPVDFHSVLLNPGEELTIYGVVFDEEVIDEGVRRWLFQNRDYYHLPLPADLGRRIVYEFEGLYEEDQKPGIASQRMISGALERILIYLIRHTRTSQPNADQSRIAIGVDFPESVQRALLYIHHHFRQPLSLKDVAHQASLAPNYFSEQFHAVVGVSFQHYLQSLRLRFAARLLAASDLPVSDILLASGFRDQAHFCRAFKTMYAASPRAYRLMAHRPQTAS
jgi:AraC-like DNA-binding protein